MSRDPLDHHMASPAKINLGLEIFWRRPGDGYHYLASIFVPISFADDLSWAWSDRPELTTTNLLSGKAHDSFEAVSERQDGNLEKNLLWKAMMFVHEKTGRHLQVNLIKQVPPGAGLGGGSSNAGTLIQSALRGNGMDPADFLRESSHLGADIPFFLMDGPALVTGIGERVHPMELGPGHGVLAIPEIHVDTAFAYNELKRSLQPGPPPENLSMLSEGVRRDLASSRWSAGSELENHFEPVVFDAHPELARIKEGFLVEHAQYASLSGSGSALFALVESREAAGELRSRMEQRHGAARYITFQF